MPRTARKKSAESMYHIMSRSISEIDLFRCDADKSYYLRLLKRYIEKCHCKIYAFCLLSNHVHLYINTQGYDISSFMLALNSAYVSYYNRKYNRHGHLFQGRFTSKIVNNDTYSLTLSAYIHNNTKNLPGEEGKEELYRFSSYGIYTGRIEDVYKIVDTSFLLGTVSCNEKTAREKYRSFVEAMRNMGIIEKMDAKVKPAFIENEYRSEKSYIIRPDEPDELILKISRILKKGPTSSLVLKYSRDASEFRAFSVYVMRIICGHTYSKICKYIGNMSMSGIRRLCNEGFRLYNENMEYHNAFYSLIKAG